MAFEGRPGPVLLDLPDDLQRVEIDPRRLKSFIPPKKTYHLSSAKVKKTLKLIQQAKRPVVIVGGGVKLAGAEEQLKRFLGKSGMPFATTWSTIDMFLEHTPKLIGNFGVSANRAGNFTLQNADLIISLGSRLDTHEAGSNARRFAPRAKKIVVDIDRPELNKNNGIRIDLGVNCDVKTFLRTLNSAVIKTQDLSHWNRSIGNWRKRYPVCLQQYYRQQKKVNPYVLMDQLSRLSKQGAIIITDAGATLTWTMQAYKIRKPQILFSAFNHSPMGYALAASIGAQYAAPKRQVVCITGDGGMQMNIQELETIAYNKLPIKIFLVNNRGYGIIKQTQDTWLDSRHVAADPASGLGFPDFQRVAQAYGIKTQQISSHKQLKRIITRTLKSKGAILCDVRVRQGEKIKPKLEFGRQLEDMSPLLSRKELKENMPYE
ncbi:MAG: thiamine pyrophosphate-binding protein, partial [Candidatus Omnitrophica bacterium]|nr:thiamine pyrophosphate-binding protein [Candidatus Omnitrophota bacterium]